MIMSFNCRLDFVDASCESITAFFRDATSRPASLQRNGRCEAYGPGRLSDGDQAADQLKRCISGLL
ncbi:MAG: hypothetical protein PHQ39_10635 [Methanothrix soehngenii]|nr:hypothetical protein [Methanothrix soehngenii]